MSDVPLVVFAFNRPHKLRQVVDAVLRQRRPVRRLIAVLDGPRHGGDAVAIEECRKLFLILSDVMKVEIIRNTANLGCAVNIMEHTHSLAMKHGQIAVLEDDVLPSTNWYGTVCDLLARYATNPWVLTVGTFPSLLTGALPDYRYDVIHSSRFCPWGWGTWAERWERVYLDWRHCLDNGQPPWNNDRLPGHAGGDIAGMVASIPASKLWDGIVVASHLNRGAFQAQTRHYLSNNIGADIHLEPGKLKFMMDNNAMRDVAPEAYPPEVKLDEEVMAAVRDYVRAMTS